MLQNHLFSAFKKLLQKLFEGGDPPQSIAVAVSGGPDSILLMHFLKIWAASQGVVLHVVYVNHKLRPAADQEALDVKTSAEMLHLSFKELIWDHPPITTGIQEKARTARYHLLKEYCLAQGIRHLFLAHHQDDAMETFLLRLLRGSDLRGLSNIPPCTPYEGLLLVRPFLCFTKKIF